MFRVTLSSVQPGSSCNCQRSTAWFEVKHSEEVHPPFVTCTTGSEGSQQHDAASIVPHSWLILLMVESLILTSPHSSGFVLSTIVMGTTSPLTFQPKMSSNWQANKVLQSHPLKTLTIPKSTRLCQIMPFWRHCVMFLYKDLCNNVLQWNFAQIILRCLTMI